MNLRTTENSSRLSHDLTTPETGLVATTDTGTLSARKRKPPAIVLGLFGIILIAALYVRWPHTPERYLWHDEAWRAWLILATASPQAAREYAVKERLFVQLSEWGLGKIGLSLFGKTALAFRIWPLLFAMIGLVGVFVFVSTMTSPSAALLATFLIGTGEGFILHSREFKPYTLDFALTIWTFYALVHAPHGTRKRNDAFLCVLLHLFALSSLVFAFVFPAVALERIRRMQVSSRLAWVTLISPPVVFLLLLVLFLHPQQGTSLDRFWQSHYANSLANLRFLALVALPKSLSLFIPGWHGAFLSFFVFFPLLAIRNRDRLGLLLLTPFFVQLGMSILGRYPMWERPSYYLFGLMAIVFALVVSSGIRWLVKSWPTYQDRIETSVVLALIGALVLTGRVTPQVSRAMQWPSPQGREVFALLAREFHPGDHLQLGYGVYFTFLFYKDLAFSSNPALLAQKPQRHEALNDRNTQALCMSLKNRIADILVGDRVFFVSTHNRSAYVYYREVLSRIGKVSILVGELHQSLILLEVTQPPQTFLCS